MGVALRLPFEHAVPEPVHGRLGAPPRPSEVAAARRRPGSFRCSDRKAGEPAYLSALLRYAPSRVGHRHPDSAGASRSQECQDDHRSTRTSWPSRGLAFAVRWTLAAGKEGGSFLSARRGRSGTAASGPSLTAEGATTNGGHAIHCGRRRWLERPLYDAPLPLVANNWPSLDDPKPASACAASGHQNTAPSTAWRRRSMSSRRSRGIPR